jgi:dolichol-phosphate mannosyltransferase
MTLGIVVSAFNEEAIIEKFYNEIISLPELSSTIFKLYFVNDGSTDNTLFRLKSIAAKDPRIVIISFSRNFGHEAAMLAGIDHAMEDAVICIDGDLQHPVKKIPEMLAAFARGAEIIKMQRTSREDGGILKKISSHFFYKVLNWLSPVKFSNNATDFFLVSSRVVKVLRTEYRERTRFLRGFLEIMGFKMELLTFEARSREAGNSKYSLSKLVLLSLSALVSFSSKPLMLGLFFGVFSIFFSAGIILYSIYNFFFSTVPSGYSTIVVLMSFLFCIVFFILGIICLYLAYLIEETRKRPIYLIDEIVKT